MSLTKHVFTLPYVKVGEKERYLLVHLSNYTLDDGV
jgi:hypothetical protein